MVRAVATRSRSRQPEIDKETEKPQSEETMTPQETTALITQGTPRYKKCSQLTLSVDVS